MTVAAIGGVLLRRVRRMFLGLCVLLVFVEVVEWLDSDAVLWPDRSIAAVGIAASLAWAVTLPRRGRPNIGLDLGFAALVAAVGWGLGRPGAVLSLLLGGTLLRALYGSRRSVIGATSANILAYASVGGLLYGPSGLTDLNLIVVAIALGGFVAVIRLVAESLATHDVDAAWDHVVTAAGSELLSAESMDEVTTIVDRNEAALHAASLAAPSGLVSAPTDGSSPAGLVVRLERLATEAQLVARRLAGEARFRDLAERSRDGIYLRSLDDPDMITWMNPAGRKLLAGLIDEDATAFRGDFSMVHADDRDGLEALRPEREYVREPVQVRLGIGASLDGADSSERWVSLEEHPFSYRDEDGLVDLVQGTVRDVSRQRREEEALRGALEQQEQAGRRLQQLDDLRATFLSAVSHELRTPLAALLGSSQTLAVHRERLSADQSNALADAVHRQAGRLQRLLDDLLDVERLTQGRIEARRAPTELLSLAEAVVDALEVDTSHVSVTGDEVVAAVDAAQVERIVDNLVRNALKHTGDGTPVRVQIEASASGARVVVEDDGSGVPPALRATLFEPFVQGPGADLAASPGTGIGLSLVGKFAELHGGRAWVEPADGGGARFVVELPDGPANVVVDDGTTLATTRPIPGPADS